MMNRIIDNGFQTELDRIKEENRVFLEEFDKSLMDDRS